MGLTTLAVGAAVPVAAMTLRFTPLVLTRLKVSVATAWIVWLPVLVGAVASEMTRARP